MSLKTITGRSMAEALALVKRELGTDALILHTRTYKRGGLFGIGGHTMVEITATNELPPRRQPAEAPRPARRPAPASAPTPQPDHVSALSSGDLIRRTYNIAQAQARQAPVAAAAAATATLPPPSPSAGAALLAEHPAPRAAAPVDVPAISPLADEMRAVRRLVERLMHQQRGDGLQEDLPEALFDHYLALLQQEVTEDLAREIVNHVREQLGAEQCEDQAAVRRALVDSIANYIPSGQGAELMLKPTEDGRPRTIALIGPTGVGKTTTIAKLAATFKLRQNKHVGLITLDTYRIAAVEQLRTYADIIGLPLHVVSSPEELRRAIHKCRGCDVVLIDTAGRSQRDDPRLRQLKSFLDAAQPHEVHLVLACTATQKVMLEAAERFSAVRADRIIFTKLDEAVTFGVLVNVARQVGKELSYVTTGQEVPHQIEIGQARRLAELVLGGAL